MLRYILTFIALYLAYRLLRRLISLPKGYHRDEGVDNASGAVMTKDPACGTYFLKSQGVEARVAREVLYFCSEECKEKYLEERRDE